MAALLMRGRLGRVGTLFLQSGRDKFLTENIGWGNIHVAFLGGCKIQPDFPVDIFLMIANHIRPAAQIHALGGVRGHETCRH